MFGLPEGRKPPSREHAHDGPLSGRPLETRAVHLETDLLFSTEDDRERILTSERTPSLASETYGGNSCG